MITEKIATDYLADNIARLLAANEWSQRELARRANEMPMTINRILNRLHLPTVAAVSNIAEAFGVSIDDLLKKPPGEKSL